MAKHVVVAADGIGGGGLELLRGYFGSDGVVARGGFSEDELAENISGFDALLVRSATRVTRRALEAAGPRLKIIGRAGVGTDNIDKAAATERGVIVMNTPFGNTVSAAEQAVALIFATARNVARADRLMQAGKWEKKALVGSEVHGKTLAVIGFGKIGQHVARVMQAAGMRVVAFDPFFPAERARELKAELLSDVDEALAQADFVTLHVPLTDQTRNLLSAGRLARLKRGARVVKCARGGLVDEAALAEAVGSGRLAAAGLDVFSREPMVSGPLFGVDGITLTPHLGASTEEAEERCGVQMAEQVIAYFREGKIHNAVNITFSPDPSLSAYAELAAAMGRIASILVNAPANGVEVRAGGGFFADKDCGILRFAAVKGVLAAFGLEGVNDVNAMFLAQQRGIRAELVLSDGGADAPRVDHIDIRVRGRGEDGTLKETRLAGTVYQDGRKRLIQIDDADIEVRLDDHMLFLRYPDKPGVIGRVGTILGDRGINIENMQVGILKRQKRASMVIGTGAAVPMEVVETLRRDPRLEIERIYSVNIFG
ncbi:MAG: phosphoglycerate dehydrogenase [Planctomycetota bacterium]|jgi:D-3-phosphoglycerate dehydrogenase|nr:phosphoglycerate dehydrogenase [Planctomycetota bacterium]